MRRGTAHAPTSSPPHPRGEPVRRVHHGAVQYDDVIAATFDEPDHPPALPVAVTDAAPARRLRDAAEPVAMHPVWCRATNEALAARGLDFLSAYVWGRAAALGEPAPGVVVAAFGAFAPGLVSTMYEAGRTACDRDTLLSVRAAATTASLAEVLAGEDEVDEVASVLQRAVEGVHTAGRPLFAGLAGQAWPGEPVGRLWSACERLRELRGDAHVAVWAAAGLDPVEVNVLTERWLDLDLGSYSATRGWTGGEIAAAAGRLADRGLMEGEVLTGAGRAFRADLEARTDHAMAPVLAALGGELDAVATTLERWSGACIAAGAFPPDPRKRAAG